MLLSVWARPATSCERRAVLHPSAPVRRPLVLVLLFPPKQSLVVDDALALRADSLCCQVLLSQQLLCKRCWEATPVAL